jgi:hypothetical protein
MTYKTLCSLCTLRETIKLDTLLVCHSLSHIYSFNIKNTSKID